MPGTRTKARPQQQSVYDTMVTNHREESPYGAMVTGHREGVLLKPSPGRIIVKRYDAPQRHRRDGELV